MSVYLRTSRNTGVSLRGWLAVPYAIGWLVWMTLVWTFMATAWLVRTGVRGWQSWRARRRRSDNRP